MFQNMLRIACMLVCIIFFVSFKPDPSPETSLAIQIVATVGHVDKNICVIKLVLVKLSQEK